MRAPGPQSVKALGKTLPTLARQAKNQVRVQVRGAVGHQPLHMGLGAHAVLAAGNGFLHLGVEALDANLKLQRTGGKAGDTGLQCVGQMVRDQLKMHKHRVLRRLFQALQKKLQNAHRGLDFEVESPVHKFEGACASGIQAG